MQQAFDQAGGHAGRVAVIGPHSDTAALQFPTYTYPAWREATLAMSSGELGNMVGVDPGMASWNSNLLPPMPTETLVHDRYGARTLSEQIAEFGLDEPVPDDLDDIDARH